MLSKKAKYALIAMVALARKYGEGPIVISDLTKEEGIPRKFTELILLEMKNNGLLHSKKGKGGGYWLRKPPTEITLGTIIRLIDGPLAPVSCVSLTAYQKCEECKDEATCGIKLVMKEVRDSIANILDSTSLRDVLDRVNAQNQTIMYYI
ncbi:MAG TPA: Rrf2 family transcriptional regulator [bacterium]|nr:Rrf2 family transcriptional regulator [bacterium]HOL96501.1 Rrf2 family transcriptional regulator [bacterium]HPP01932.1 Rrf2 family transcriptional regulator [bacterium]HXK95498.1 Rrf2 family transcriptional regulator [bacterium]